MRKVSSDISCSSTCEESAFWRSKPLTRLLGFVVVFVEGLGAGRQESDAKAGSRAEVGSAFLPLETATDMHTSTLACTQKGIGECGIANIRP